jgi:hypothetical protein
MIGVSSAYWQNNTGDDIIINDISFGLLTGENTWTRNRIFTSTASSGSSWIQWGIGNDNTGIDSVHIKFNNNGEITPYLSRVFNHLDGSGKVYYGWKLSDLNIKVANTEYFYCQLSGTFSGATDSDFWSGVFYKKKV